MKTNIKLESSDLSQLSGKQLQAIMRGIGEVITADRRKIVEATNFLERSYANEDIECSCAVLNAIKILKS